jgi:hypothetical protein
MNNILITTTTRDNLGTKLDFYETLNDIEDSDLREMVKMAILGKDWSKGDLWAVNNMCGSERGYAFEGGCTFPYTVEHHVNYVF